MQFQLSNKSKFMRQSVRNLDMAPIDIAKRIYNGFDENKFKIMKEIAPMVQNQPSICLSSLGIEVDEKWIGDALGEVSTGTKIGDIEGIEPSVGIWYHGLSEPEYVTLEQFEDENEFILGDELKFWIDNGSILFDTANGEDISEFLDGWGMYLSDGIRVTNVEGFKYIVQELARVLLKVFHTSLEGNQSEFIDYLAINYSDDIKNMGLIIDNVTIEEMIEAVDVHRCSPILELKGEEDKALSLLLYGVFKIMSLLN